MLRSGQVASGRVSSSSCHNYYMNVTDIGYSLVVDLNTSSSALFLLVKASPILRHSLEDEHNYANYYQFKKQGGHHGVVVTSDHLSPGRWYIGVCNYVQEAPTFDDKKRGGKTGAQGGRPATEYAEYSFIPTLEVSKGGSGDDDCGPECQGRETEARLMLELSAPELSKSKKCLKDGTCNPYYSGFTVDEIEPASYPKPAEATLRADGKQEGAELLASAAPVPEQSQHLHHHQQQQEQQEQSRPQPIGECGGGLPLVHPSKEAPSSAPPHTTLSSRLLDAALVIFLGALAGGVLLAVCSPGASSVLKGAPSEVYKAADDVVQAEKIAAQLEEARRACGRLQEELEEERLAARSRHVTHIADSARASEASSDAVESATRALGERLREERERAGKLTAEAGRWRQAAEDAQAILCRLQREKAAAEHAAHVLETEMQLAQRQMTQLARIEETSTAAAASLPREAMRLSSDMRSRSAGRIGDALPTRRAGTGGVAAPASSPLHACTADDATSFFSDDATSFFSPVLHRFGGSSPAPPAGGSFRCPSTAPPPTPSSAAPSPYAQTPGSCPASVGGSSSKHFDNGSSLGFLPLPRAYGRMEAAFRKEGAQVNSEAFAAFMGVDVCNSDLLGELEPLGELSLSAATADCAATPRREGGGETRARGRRGGQRRKRAVGDNSAQLDNAATDSLATSMALAALGDSDL